MPLTVRPAEMADLPAIVQLMNSAFRGTGWTTESDYIAGERTSEPALQEILAGTHQTHLLVTQTDSAAPIVGCVSLQPRGIGIWVLGSLAIEPGLQNSGLGRALLEASEQWAIAHGATNMQMNVINIRDTLIAWYQRRGYVLTGERHPFPYGNDRFGTPLRDDLAFVVLQKDLLRHE